MVGELHLDGVVVAAIGPGVAELGPVVGLLLLAAVGIKALLEQAVFVPQTVAGQGNVGGGGGIQEAGSQTAQAAVAQCVVLDFLQAAQVNAPSGEELLHLIQNAQVVQVGIHQPANQVLGGEIVSLPLVHTGALAVAPVVCDGHHHSLAQGLVELLGSCLLQGHVIGVL